MLMRTAATVVLNRDKMTAMGIRRKAMCRLIYEIGEEGEDLQEVDLIIVT